MATLWLLASGCRHYSQLAARLPGISPKVLAQQLRELERDGLVTRHETTRGRRRVRYELTVLGEALRPLLQELERWGHEYGRARTNGSDPFRSG
jgi:DNA-binding HxlR family transcriptional regulator